MGNTVWLIVGSAALLAAAVAMLIGMLRWRQRRSPIGWVLTATVLAAIAALALTTGWLLLSDSATSKSDAIKSGGLAAGSVVAIYALWLNDRRRRVEEQRQNIDRLRQQLDQQRQELESRRAEHDRERVADERFARAVELLGKDADQVRVGALHALAGLARSRPVYTQTVLDVLCSYLRRPFQHPNYLVDEPPWSEERVEAADRELQVRLTAQRLIKELLPKVDSAQEGVEPPYYDLDLTGACLERFELNGRYVGALFLFEAKLHRPTRLDNAVIHYHMYLNRATIFGPMRCMNTRFLRKARFTGCTARSWVDFSDSHFDGTVKFADAVFEDAVLFGDATSSAPFDLRYARFRGNLDLKKISPPTANTLGMTVDTDREVQLPDGWILEPDRDSTIATVKITELSTGP